jgi:short-subunit dehydrogenase
MPNSNWLTTFSGKLFGTLNQPIDDWRGKTVWLVGASSGIGAALAQQLLAQEAKVILSARRADQLSKVANAHPNAIIKAFDASDKASWSQVNEQVLQELGKVDLIIFCAAKYQPERTWEVDSLDAQETLNINLLSIYHGLQSVLPQMIKDRHGGIALIASVAGYFGLPNASVYGPSKAALINLAEIMYADLRPKNINVYLINPGFVSTPLTAKNNFFMPAIQTPVQAANEILLGMQRGKFEIHFPKRFTYFLKLLQCLPYRLRFMLLRRLAID